MHTFDYHTDQLSLNPAATFNYSHWYATSLTLADGRVLLLGGIDGNHNGVGTPEIYTHGVGWQTLPGPQAPILPLIGFIRVPGCRAAARLLAFRHGEGDNAGTLFKMTTGGAGSITNLGYTPFESENYDPAAMFAQDKILTIDKNGNAWIMDISGATPTFTQTAESAPNRAWSNLIDLADGTVLLTGGSIGSGPTTILQPRPTMP